MDEGEDVWDVGGICMGVAWCEGVVRVLCGMEEELCGMEEELCGMWH